MTVDPESAHVDIFRRLLFLALSKGRVDGRKNVEEIDPLSGRHVVKVLCKHVVLLLVCFKNFHVVYGELTVEFTNCFLTFCGA